MITARCIQKFRNKSNKIIGYRLQDSQGDTRDLTPQQLKDAIHNNQIHVLNLKLTSNNRLIDTTPTKQPKQTIQQPKTKNKTAVQQQFSLLTREIIRKINKSKALKFKSNQNLEAINHKAQMLGHTTTKLSNDFLSIESNTEIILVSNKQIQLDNTYSNGLFQEADFTSINFHNTDTSNVTNMEYMFYDCKAQTLDLSSFDTSNVTNMSSMFSICQAKTINLSNFDTSNVTDMKYMFYDCKAQTIDISSFDTSNVTNMHNMFSGCQAKTLDLSNFNTSNVTNMNYMFSICQAKTINLSSFNTSNVTDMNSMFFQCQAQTLDLSSFDTSNVTNMEYMFSGCQAQIKTTDPKLNRLISK